MAEFEAAGASERLRSLAILREMQRKLKEGAAFALGLDKGASPQEARRAFLALTKQYHPAKFARLDEPTVRLANEVFLDLREAYESLLASPALPSRRLGTDPGHAEARRPRSDVRPPQQRNEPAPPVEPRSLRAIPGTASPALDARTRAEPTRGALRPDARPEMRPDARPDVRPDGRPDDPPRPTAAPPRAVDGPRITAARPAPSGLSGAARPTAAPAPQPRPLTGGPFPDPARVTAAPARPDLSAGRPTPAPSRSSEVAGARTSATTGTSQLQVRFASPPAARAAAPTSPTTSSTPAGLHLLLQQKRWAEARALMQERVAAEPGERRHLAWLSYVRACEAAELGKLADARRELTRALAIEPTLAEASAKLAALTDATAPGRK